MAIQRSIGIGVGIMVATALAAQAVPFTTSGTYDEQANQTNTVDSIAAAATAGDQPLVIEAGEYGAYKTTVASSHSAGLGGVVHFDENNYVVAPNVTFQASYASGTKLLDITPVATYITLSGNLTSQTPISGGTGTVLTQPEGMRGGVIYMGNEPSLTLNLGAITGGLPGEYVDSFGITMLSRTSREHLGTTAVATFSDSSTATATSDVGAGDMVDDTFFGFVAPAGKSITSVTISWSSNLVAFDDISFTTIPEPGTLALLAAGLGLVAVRRKRG